jgi:hypothetical protein
VSVSVRAKSIRATVELDDEVYEQGIRPEYNIHIRVQIHELSKWYALFSLPAKSIC